MSLPLAYGGLGWDSGHLSRKVRWRSLGIDTCCGHALGPLCMSSGPQGEEKGVRMRPDGLLVVGCLIR